MKDAYGKSAPANLGNQKILVSTIVDHFRRSGLSKKVNIEKDFESWRTRTQQGGVASASASTDEPPPPQTSESVLGKRAARDGSSSHRLSSSPSKVSYAEEPGEEGADEEWAGEEGSGEEEEDYGDPCSPPGARADDPVEL